jgi:hypothetical protein
MALLALAGLLAGCGSPEVIVVTATATPVPEVIVVVVTPVPPSPAPSPTATPGATPLGEEARAPFLGYLGLSHETSADGWVYTIEIPFRDADGDASSVHWSIVSSTSQDVQVEDGSIDASPLSQQQGASTSGTWTCGEEKYTVVLELTVQDAAGHSSDPQQVTIVCPGVEPSATPTPEDTPTPEPTWTPGPTHTPYPTPAPNPPAKVVGTLPDTIACQPQGAECLWEWTVTFTEQNGTGATISRISIIYTELDGQQWTRGGGEWSSESISIHGFGSNTYDSWVRSAAGGESELRGATVRVGWEGTDAEGNAFSGSTTARLASGP